MERKQQMLRAIKMCKYGLNVGYDIGSQYTCAVLTLWGKGFCRVLKTTIIPNEPSV